MVRNLSDKQIRLEILLDYYKAMQNQSGIPSQKDNEKLNKIVSKEYNSNYNYLVNHGLVDGGVTRTTDGAKITTPQSGISPEGMDIIERLLDKHIPYLVKHLEEPEKGTFDDDITYLDKIKKLDGLWISNFEMHLDAGQLLSTLISDLLIAEGKPS